MSKAKRVLEMCERGGALQRKDRTKINNGLWTISKQKWATIPFDEIKKAFAAAGMILLQEDDTPWSGMFLGAKGEAKLNFGYADSETVQHIILDEDPDKTIFNMRFEPISNSLLILQWYKDTGMTKYEINAYLS